MLCCTNKFIPIPNLCGYLPVCSGGGVTVRGCGVGGVSGGVESAIREGGGGGSTGYERNAVMGAGKFEEGTRVGPGVTCEYRVVGVAAAPDEDGGQS